MSTPDLPISYNFIHKGNSESLMKAVDSVLGALYREGDECVIVDTGSSQGQFRRLRKKAKKLDKKCPCRVVDARHLSVDYTPYAEKYLSPALLQEFQEYTGSITGILDFAEARNIAMAASDNDLIFWADSDDVLVEQKTGHLREMINRVFGEWGQGKFDNIFLDYQYAFDENDGALITLLRRERVFRKSRMVWKGRCHEVAIPREGVDLQKTIFDENVKSYIVHTEARKPHRISDIRNYIILRKEIEETKEHVDPRTVFYLANAARGLDRFKEALHYYDWFNYHSGSVDDRFGAAYYSASMYLHPALQRPFDALEQYWKCIKIKPLDPRGYIGVSRCFGALSRWRECLSWYNVSRQFQMSPDQVFSYDPTHVDYHPHLMAAHAAQELEDVATAKECIMRAVQARPGLKEAQQFFEEIRNWSMGQELKNSVATIAHNLPGGAHPRDPNVRRVVGDLLSEVRSAPESLEKLGFGKKEPLEGREKKPEIAIWCGSSGENWGPYRRATGIGGSEKMVIMLADALQRTGKVNVSVYCNIPFQVRGIYDTGVAWYHWSEFDEERPRDVLVLWRSPEAAKWLPSPARKRVIWCHDVQDPRRYNDEVMACTDFVQVQSCFHAAPLVKTVPLEKLWIARNAIEVHSGFENIPPRDPKQVLFCSSPDRGLRTATEIVKRAKKIDPEICLVVSYGITPWARKAYAENNHRYIPDLGRDACVDEYERDIYKALDEIGATNVHRIGFPQMDATMQTSGVWLYPTRFPEISCMSAMEAQQNGCVVLATNYGALAETIMQTSKDLCSPLDPLPEGGDISDDWLDEAAMRLVEACKICEETHEDRQMIADAADEYFSVDNLAQEWLEKLELFPMQEKSSKRGKGCLLDVPSSESKDSKAKENTDLPKNKVEKGMRKSRLPMAGTI